MSYHSIKYSGQKSSVRQLNLDFNVQQQFYYLICNDINYLQKS